MKESTKEAFITVLDAMITHANRRIAGIKRRKSGGKMDLKLDSVMNLMLLKHSHMTR